ncbi:hypothetical protein RF647_13420, partial [Kocuria sp. CPCC 205263]
HDCLGLPGLQRDLLAHAANELIDHRIGGHAPYSWDLRNGDRKRMADGAGEAEGESGLDGTA